MKNKVEDNTQSLKKLMHFLDSSPSAFHATANMAARLESVGFKKIDFRNLEQIEEGFLGYISPNSSSLYAIAVGKDFANSPAKLYGAHSDSPCLRIKPCPLIRRENYYLLATEVYGGPILNTWFDEELSLAGRVAIRSKDPFKPEMRLLNIDRPLFSIPNVAIHMNREVNNGYKIDPLKLLLPVLGQICEDDQPDSDPFLALLAEELKCEPSDILDYDLFTYPYEKSRILGLNSEFLASARLDNLLSAHAGVKAFEDLAKKSAFKGLCFLAISDNEEIGSKTKQRADSFVLRQFFDLSCQALGLSKAQSLAILEEAYMLSSDLAHAVHPHYTELSDANNRPRINGGPVLKLAANQSYCSDAESAAIFYRLCELADLPYQRFVNRSDLRGGSTIGPISSSLMPVRCADIGLAVWGMHSARELGGVKDLAILEKLLELYFSI